MKIRRAIRSLKGLGSRPGVTVVGMESHAVDDGILLTRNAATCVWLAAHNARTKRGLLGHFSAVSGDWGMELPHKPADRYAGMEAFAAAVKEIPELGPLEQTDIVAGGAGEEYDKVSFPDMWFERKFAIATIGNVALDSRRFRTRWAEFPNQQMTIKLDCPAGRLLIANRYR